MPKVANALSRMSGFKASPQLCGIIAEMAYLSGSTYVSVTRNKDFFRASVKGCTIQVHLDEETASFAQIAAGGDQFVVTVNADELGRVSVDETDFIEICALPTIRIKSKEDRPQKKKGHAIGQPKEAEDGEGSQPLAATLDS